MEETLNPILLKACLCQFCDCMSHSLRSLYEAEDRNALWILEMLSIPITCRFVYTPNESQCSVVHSKMSLNVFTAAKGKVMFSQSPVSPQGRGDR